MFISLLWKHLNIVLLLIAILISIISLYNQKKSTSKRDIRESIEVLTASGSINTDIRTEKQGSTIFEVRPILYSFNYFPKGRGIVLELKFYKQIDKGVNIISIPKDAREILDLNLFLGEISEILEEFDIDSEDIELKKSGLRIEYNSIDSVKARRLVDELMEKII